MPKKPIPLAELSTKLSFPEQQELTRCEITIKTGLRDFFEVGFALCQIREKKLYRKTHDTFEDYCKDRWDMSRDYAYKQISAASVVQNVDQGIQKPESERQARPLTKLPPEQQSTAWQKAVETAPEGKITARHVEKTVREIIGDPAGKIIKSTREKINKDGLIEDDFRDAFNGFIGAIQNARAAKWKTTSKEAVIKILQSLLTLLEGESKNV